MTLDKIQLGVDLATSATILITLATWAVESRRRANKERKIDINEQTRSASLEKTNQVLHEVENSFHEIIAAATTFERSIDRRVTHTDDDKLDFSLLDKTINKEFIDENLSKLNEIRIKIDQYYELISKRRYSLIPILESLKGGESFKNSFLKDIDQIGKVHNKIGSGWFGLLREFHNIVDHFTNLAKEHNLSSSEDSDVSKLIELLMSDDGFKERCFSLLLDDDYLPWVKYFVPNDSMGSFKKLESETIGQVFSTFLIYTITETKRQYAEILYHASHEILQARVECKDIPIKLSALSSVLLSKQNNSILEETVEKFEGEKYFGRNTFIR